MPVRDVPNDALTAITARRREATLLHRQFLALHGSIDERLASLRRAPAGRRIDAKIEVGTDAWFLDGAGRMAAGMVAHEVLALVGRLTDTRDRTLECEITFEDSPPQAGETLHSEAVADAAGSTFHGGCASSGRARLSVRGAWAAANDGLPPPRSLDPSGQPSFGPDAVRACAEGRLADCFGEDWEATRAHVRSPHVGAGRCRLLDEIVAFDRDHIHARGGPLPAGHELPVGLLLEGCLQTMAFHLSAVGLTVECDGWRFEPVPEVRCALRWHGERIGEQQQIEYQVSVSALHGGSCPTVHADAVCVVDGQTVLHARGLALRLVRDWPLVHWRKLGPAAHQRTGDPVPLWALGGLRGYRDAGPVAEVAGIRYDFATLLAAAWGPMSQVFSPASMPAADDRRLLRMPGPPFLFVTRLTELPDTPGAMQVGSRVAAEYDLPDDVWYHEENGARTMPIAVLLEIAMQPCGMLAAYIGSATASEDDVRIRNLDGDLTMLREIPPRVAKLSTTVEVTGIERWDETLLETFRVRCLADGSPVLEGTLAFGLFAEAAFHPPTAMRVGDAERQRLEAPCDGPVIDLRSRPARYFGRPLRLPGAMLLMLDRVTGWWPDGGPAGLGRLRAESDVRADAWYFKAHFFTDPVQPGSLGIEAMCQLLQFYLIELGVGADLKRPRFEAIHPGERMTWTMRGQIVPTDGRFTIEMDVLDVRSGADGGHAVAQAWLWIDGRRIYHVPRLQMRVVPDESAREPAPAVVETWLDPDEDAWLEDHRPAWTISVLPLMSMVDLLARAASDYAGRDVRALRDVQLQRWLPVPQPTRLRISTRDAPDAPDVTLSTWREATNPAFSRFAPVAGATARLDTPPRPARFAPLADARTVPDPYASAELFHGPSFRYLVSAKLGASGASGVLDAARGTVPRGALHQGLLDAATHVIPHASMWRWSPAIDPQSMGSPHRLETLNIFEPLPDRGAVDVEARFRGLHEEDRRLAVVDVQMCSGDRVLVDFRLIVILLSLGAQRASPTERRAFIRDRRYVAQLLLSEEHGDDTVLHDADVERIDHVPGSVNTVYNLPLALPTAESVPRIAAKEHVARRTAVHPCFVELAEDLRTAHCSGVVHRIEVTRDEAAARVRDRA